MIGATTKFIIEFAADAREKEGGCLVRTLRVSCVWKKKRRRGRQACWTFVENFVAIHASLLRGDRVAPRDFRRREGAPAT
jgi:hypothetical protein